MSNDASRNGSGPARHVRTFVLRAGRTTRAQQRALQELWPQYGIGFTTDPVDLDAIFGRSAPRMLEIGFGAGEALLAFARTHPDYDCIGVEVHPPGVGHLLLELERNGLTNVRVIAHDAIEVLAHMLPSCSIDLVHIFFPDPWPKKRHHKRRLVQPAFLPLLQRVLKPHAHVRLATDWAHYAQQMLATFESNETFENVHGAGAYAPRNEDRPLTRFELRGQRLGHGVWDLHYRLRSQPQRET